MSFLGNTKLRRAGERLRYTPAQVDELRRCYEDPIYFMENYVKIISLDSEKLILLKLRPYQKKMVDTVVNNRFVISRWPRQSAKTTTAAAIILWHVLFRGNYRVLVVANLFERARDILALIQRSYENLPYWMQQGLLSWNKSSMELENGSLIKTAGTSGSSGRGGAYSFVLVDEAAHVATHIAENFFNSVMPTISSGSETKIVITSTPLGLNHFYTMYQKAVKGQNGYIPLDVRWNEVPGRDEAFRQRIIADRGETYFNQEFACVAADTLVTLRNTQTKEIISLNISDVPDLLTCS